MTAFVLSGPKIKIERDGERIVIELTNVIAGADVTTKMGLTTSEAFEIASSIRRLASDAAGLEQFMADRLMADHRGVAAPVSAGYERHWVVDEDDRLMHWREAGWKHVLHGNMIVHRLVGQYPVPRAGGSSKLYSYPMDAPIGTRRPE